MNEERFYDEPHCLECAKELKGRIDKRFCGDACRASFNNKKRQAIALEEPVFLKEIPKILLSNYRILVSLNPEQKTTVARKVLEQLGFNFQYITSFYKTAEGDVYRFCFDQGYLLIKNERVLLVKQASQVML